MATVLSHLALFVLLCFSLFGERAHGDGRSLFNNRWQYATDHKYPVLDAAETALNAYALNYALYADLNGDGAIDIFGMSENRVAWYKNDGKGAFNYQLLSSLTLPVRPAFAAVDIDNDGHLDLFFIYNQCSGMAKSCVRFFRNDGSGSFSSGTYILEIVSGDDWTGDIWSIDFADFNGDGVLDLVYGGEGGVAVRLGTGGDGVSFNSTDFFINKIKDTRSVSCVDLNGDGWQDIVVVRERLPEKSYGHEVDLFFILTYGTNEKRSAERIPTSIYKDVIDDTPWNAIGVDIDGDGDMDILPSWVHSSVAWLENDGNMTFSIKYAALPLSNSSTFTPGDDFFKKDMAVDLNGDGHLDILSHSYGNTGYYDITWYENKGDQSFFAHTLSQAQQSNYSYHSLLPFDVDGDGDVDVLSTCALGEMGFFWYEQMRGDSMFGDINPIASGKLYRQHYAVDFDGDSDVDIVTLSGDSGTASVQWWENDGAQAFTSHDIYEGNLDAKSLVVADIDQDGDLDVLLAVAGATAATSGVYWAENHGNQIFTKSQAAVVVDGRHGIILTISVVDIDGDGDLDLLVPGSPEFSLYLNNGNKTFSLSQVFNQGSAFMAVAQDVNLDGYVDIISADHDSGRLDWYQNSIGLSFTYANIATDPGCGPTYIKKVDVDGDGMEDIVLVCMYSSTLKWFRAVSGQWNEYIITTSINARNVEVSDIDGDGDMDLVTVSSDNGMLVWYENDGYQNFRPYTIEGMSISLHPEALFGALYLGDIDSNGLDDIIVSGHNSTHNFGWVSKKKISTTLATFSNQSSSVAEGALSDVEMFNIDLDGDGDEDLLVKSAQNLSWYENLGASLGFNEHLVSDQGGKGGLFAVDLDRDGDVDLISAIYDQNRVVWYRNNGWEVFSENNLTNVNSSCIGPNSVFAADLERNFWFDVIVACENQLTVFSNIAQSTSDEIVLLNFTSNLYSLSSVRALDIDNDGWIDIVFSRPALTDIVILRKSASYNFIFESARSLITLVNVKSFYPVDLDGDGDVDIVGGDITNKCVTWWENDGHENFVEYRIATTNMSYVTSVTVTDIDGDGDMDVVVASRDANSIFWLENNRRYDGPEAFTVHTVTSSVNLPSAVSSADFDSDGFLDILWAEYSRNHVSWTKNLLSDVSTMLSFVEHRGSVDYTYYLSALFPADLDGDGDVDVVATKYYGGQLYFFENDGHSNFKANTIASTCTLSTSVFVIDIDLDGDLDIMCGTAYMAPGYFQNDGNQVYTYVTIGSGNLAHVIGVDIDGDGDVDILGVPANSWRITLFKNDGSQVFTEHIVYDAGLTTIDFVYAADIDGDGDLDVIASSTGSVPFLSWIENVDGTGSVWSEHNAAYFKTTKGPTKILSVAAADFDGDGHMDIVASMNSRVVQTYTYPGYYNSHYDDVDDIVVLWNDGKQNFMQHRLTQNGGTARKLRVADLEGDGDIDIIATYNLANSFTIFENLGGRDFLLRNVTTQSFGTYYNGPYDVFPVDIDMDGDLDVVTVSFQGSYYLYWYETRAPFVPCIKSNHVRISGECAPHYTSTLNISEPWGIYLASGYNSDFGTFNEARGNGRDITVSGSLQQDNYGSGGNGAVQSALISSISGTADSTLLWPEGPTNSDFTICSVTRFTDDSVGGAMGRILGDTGEDVSKCDLIHGHGRDSDTGAVYRGVASYNGTRLTNFTEQGNLTNWLVMCGMSANNKDLSSTAWSEAPYNVYVDGYPLGTTNRSSAEICQLAVNFKEPSDWALHEVVIWDRILSYGEIGSIMSKKLLELCGPPTKHNFWEYAEFNGCTRKYYDSLPEWQVFANEFGKFLCPRDLSGFGPEKCELTEKYNWEGEIEGDGTCGDMCEAS